MMRQPFSKSTAVLVALLGAMCVPCVARAVQVRDTSLGPRGFLRGRVVDRRGAPMANTPVVIRRGGRAVARTVTTADGRFSTAGLRGGCYRIETARGSQYHRVWSFGMAPPTALPTAEVRIEPTTVQGPEQAEQGIVSAVMDGFSGPPHEGNPGGNGDGAEGQGVGHERHGNGVGVGHERHGNGHGYGHVKRPASP